MVFSLENFIVRRKKIMIIIILLIIIFFLISSPFVIVFLFYLIYIIGKKEKKPITEDIDPEIDIIRKEIESNISIIQPITPGKKSEFKNNPKTKTEDTKKKIIDANTLFYKLSYS